MMMFCKGGGGGDKKRILQLKQGSEDRMEL